MTTALEMLKRGMVEAGYDGLYNTFEPCSCELSDLAPCSDQYFMYDCNVGYKHPVPKDSECDFYIKGDKYKDE